MRGTDLACGVGRPKMVKTTSMSCRRMRSPLRKTRDCPKPGRIILFPDLNPQSFPPKDLPVPPVHPKLSWILDTTFLHRLRSLFHLYDSHGMGWKLPPTLSSSMRRRCCVATLW